MITFVENKNSNNNINNNNNINSNRNKLLKNIITLIFLFSFLNLIILKKINLNFDIEYNNNGNNNNNNNINNNNNNKRIEKFNKDSFGDIKLSKPVSFNNIEEINIEGEVDMQQITPKKIYWPTVYYNNNNNNNNVELIEWNKCVLSLMGIDANNESIGYSYIELDRDNGRLILSPHNEDNEENEENNDNNSNRNKVILAHAKSCPFHELELSNSIIHKDLQIEKLYPPVKVGVSVLVEDDHDRILLTKRSDQLRIFPGIWVLPGGHMEVGENIFETGLRELNEETGINESMVDLESFKVIGIFESSYPNLLLEDRLPVDHHIVIFLYIKLKQQAIVKPILQETEVQLAAWTPKSLLTKLLEGTHTEFDLNKQSTTTTTSSSSSAALAKDIELVYPSNIKEEDQTLDDKIKDKFFKGTDNIATGTIYILKQYLNK